MGFSEILSLFSYQGKESENFIYFFRGVNLRYCYPSISFSSSRYWRRLLEGKQKTNFSQSLPDRRMLFQYIILLASQLVGYPLPNCSQTARVSQFAIKSFLSWLKRPRRASCQNTWQSLFRTPLVRKSHHPSSCLFLLCSQSQSQL